MKNSVDSDKIATSLEVFCMSHELFSLFHHSVLI